MYTADGVAHAYVANSSTGLEDMVVAGAAAARAAAESTLAFMAIASWSMHGLKAVPASESAEDAASETSVARPV